MSNYKINYHSNIDIAQDEIISTNLVKSDLFDSSRLNIIIGIVQKVYEGPTCYFVKMIFRLGDHFGKRTA